jgi:hypothetical protein
MRRRDALSLLGGAAVSWPLTAGAQQLAEQRRRIGVLMTYDESDPQGQPLVAAFREGLRTLGWAEGRNIQIDTRWGTLDVELRQRFAKELVTLKPDLNSFTKYSHHCDAAATNAHHPHHFRERCRSGRQRLRRDLGATRRQRHRFH